MIVTEARVRRETGTPEQQALLGRYEALLYSDSLGLTQFGAFVETIWPGARSSNPHWHETQDEFLYMLDGRATWLHPGGETEIGPGEALVWPAGAPNYHALENRSDAPCRYVVAGTRSGGDVVHYPTRGETLYSGETHWQVLDAAGAVVRSGPMHDWLLGKPPRRPADPPGVGGHFRPGEVPETEVISSYPGACNLGRGQLFYRKLGDAGGLSQFGATLERLRPGGRSSQLHWHDREDEFLLLLSGRLTVQEGDATFTLSPGDAAGWQAGVALGHTVRNHATEDAVFILIGTRDPDDICHYPGLDLRSEPHAGAHRFVHLDGTPWDKPQEGTQ